MASLDLPSPLNTPQPGGQLLGRSHSEIYRTNNKWILSALLAPGTWLATCYMRFTFRSSQ